MRGLVLGVVTVLRAVARGGVEAENAATEELGLLKIRDSSVEATDPRVSSDAY
ncbi:hypothetical protein, conserved [Eimeria tenella]|uniref:Uncharacterized protein n=1 Tax=Eimeria tenella TaxID=5802 RepID=U6L132_EIMTE|nr:hypothetical protein, conserved [Eimeria tenella]CDJ41450.1 hypothetical protein, conserved [Eimeria tenella]|eukprot:XP_013232200.1 hypothetical protein, conserved [Eimeria tenella]